MEKKEIIPIQYVPIQCEEDEIDLKELIKTILKYKKLIIFITFFTTFLALLYIFIKTPLYEVKSSLQIGQINSKPIITPENLKEYLFSIYEIEIEKKFKTMPKTYVSEISIPKKSNLFINVKIDGISNEYNLKKLKEVLETIHKEFKNKIEAYKLEKQNEIQNITYKIQNIKNIEITNIQNQINRLKEKINQYQNIIKFYKEELNTINTQLKILQEKIKIYNNKIITSNDISNKIIYNNLLNKFINEIKDLNFKKEKIISKDIPTLYFNIAKLKNQINILKQTLKYDIPQKIKNLKYQINKIKLELKNTFAAKIIGKPIMSDYPVKPKKKLIITIAFITGFIFSIFLVFFIEFIKSFKEETT
jgi:uncharacterized protein involved in exopolysaccharide biosynthesis